MWTQESSSHQPIPFVRSPQRAPAHLSLIVPRQENNTRLGAKKGARTHHQNVKNTHARAHTQRRIHQHTQSAWCQLLLILELLMEPQRWP